jgi:hypothetical protein
MRHALGTGEIHKYVGDGEHEGNAYLEYQDVDRRIIWNGC